MVAIEGRKEEEEEEEEEGEGVSYPAHTASAELGILGPHLSRDSSCTEAGTSFITISSFQMAMVSKKKTNSSFEV